MLYTGSAVRETSGEIMIRATVLATVALTTACGALGQSTASPLKFEVVSIKPTPPSIDGKYMVRMRSDPGRLDYSSVTLKALIQRACEVRDFQISGPEWLTAARFDIAAKVPANTPSSKVPEMLRSLLVERFKMAVHRETKELPMYALVVGKNGLKMKESEVDPNTTQPDGRREPGAPLTNGGATANGGASAVDCGSRGETAVAAGWMINQGPGRVQGHVMNMASLANMLAALLGRPVVDQTGLKGIYDFDLDFTPNEGPRTPAGRNAASGIARRGSSPDPFGQQPRPRRRVASRCGPIATWAQTGSEKGSGGTDRG
jgi:uncharacterized protein (TIGR03435 family)